MVKVKVKFIKDFGFAKSGQEVELLEVTAALLKKKGLAEIL